MTVIMIARSKAAMAGLVKSEEKKNVVMVVWLGATAVSKRSGTTLARMMTSKVNMAQDAFKLDFYHSAEDDGAASPAASCNGVCYHDGGCGDTK